jgi:hypothetical protein
VALLEAWRCLTSRANIAFVIIDQFEVQLLCRVEVIEIDGLLPG